jgi:hypothetical protein
MQITVQRNHVAEFTFESTAQHSDPYNELDLDVVFTSPSGRELRVPAFWDGGGLWKVRFSGSELGVYRFESVCSDRDDRGLHAQSGSLSVVPSTGQSDLMGHGRIRVAADRRHFEHADGTSCFWVGDTWWMGLTKRLDWPHGFKELAADRVAKGFNTIQIVAGPLPDMDAWDPRGENEAGHPFERDFLRINPAFYDLADLKIAHLVEVGLMPCIVGMWGYYLPQIGVDRVKRFWRYLIARYGAYPVVWCICGEGKMPYYLSKQPEKDATFQLKGWTEVMAHVREIDAYHNLITIHPTQFGREQVEDPGLMDFEMLQTGHGDFDSIVPTIQSVRKAVEAQPRMPVVNAEVNYEGIMGRAWQNVQRLCFYHSVLNGTTGHTYGANGIWQMSTKEQPYGPSPHGRCWGNTPWREAAQLPGSRQIGLGGRFIRRFAWWEFERHPEWVKPPANGDAAYASLAVGIPGKLRIVYAPFVWDPPILTAFEPHVKYEASYFDPIRGSDIALGAVEPDSNGLWCPPLPPEIHDWILVVQASD